MKILYTAKATATGDGRDGKVRSSDGRLDLELAVPAEMGGAGGATNPEQLFAAGYAACFHNALRRVAQTAQADIVGSQVTAEVGIGPTGRGTFGLAVTLRIALPGVPAEQAVKLAERAHEVCPYSNATRGNIDVVLEIA
jgi:osmotically inducible protein OsmC